MKCSYVRAVSPLLLSIGLLLLVIVADTRPEMMRIPEPGSWDDYDDDLFAAAAARGDTLTPGSWDDYDDDLFAAAARDAMLPPGSWDDYDDDLFAAAATRDIAIQPFMRPLQAPFLGRKEKANDDLTGKRIRYGSPNKYKYPSLPIRPLIPSKHKGKHVMF